MAAKLAMVFEICFGGGVAEELEELESEVGKDSLERVVGVAKKQMFCQSAAPTTERNSMRVTLVKTTNVISVRSTVLPSVTILLTTTLLTSCTRCTIDTERAQETDNQ